MFPHPALKFGTHQSQAARGDMRRTAVFLLDHCEAVAIRSADDITVNSGQTVISIISTARTDLTDGSTYARPAALMTSTVLLKELGQN